MSYLPHCRIGTIHSTQTTALLCNAGNAMMVCRAKAEALLADPGTDPDHRRLMENNRRRWDLVPPVPAR